jgi:ribosomal protein S18 acetylase RimI-like enzyme
MTDPISYRRATIDDILTICELGQILNAVHHLARPDIYADATTEFGRDKPHWLSSLQEADRATFLAELGSKAVGFITVQVVKPISPMLQPMVVGRIGSVAVSEQMRGRGVGSALMKLAEEWARKHGAADMRLAVWEFNEQAVDLYQELGYEIRAFEMGKRVQTSADMAANGFGEATETPLAPAYRETSNGINGRVR